MKDAPPPVVLVRERRTVRGEIGCVVQQLAGREQKATVDALTRKISPDRLGPEVEEVEDVDSTIDGYANHVRERCRLPVGG